VDGIGAPVKVYGGKLHEFHFTRRSRLALAIAVAASAVTVWAGYRAMISTGEGALPFSILAAIAATVMVVALWTFYRAIPTVFTVGLHETGISCKLGDRRWTFQYGDEVAILTNYSLSGNLSEIEPGHQPETDSANEGPCSLSISSASEGCFRLSKEMFAGITQSHELCMTLQENFLGSLFDRDWKSLNDGREVHCGPLVIGRHSIRHGSHRIPLYDVDRVVIDSERNRLAIFQKKQTQPWQTVDLNSLANGYVVVKLLRQLDVVVQSGTVDEVKRRWTEKITDRVCDGDPTNWKLYIGMVAGFFMATMRSDPHGSENPGGPPKLPSTPPVAHDVQPPPGLTRPIVTNHRGKAAADYWAKTIYRLYNQDVGVDGLDVTKTVGQAFQSHINSQRNLLVEVEKLRTEQRSRNLNDMLRIDNHDAFQKLHDPRAAVDSDLMTLVDRHIETDRKMLEATSDLLKLAPQEFVALPIGKAASESNAAWAKLFAGIERPLDINASLLEIVAQQADSAPNKEAAELIRRLSVLQAEQESLLFEVYELRGRLKERYSGESFPLPRGSRVRR